jgi:hypothetical protein
MVSTFAAFRIAEDPAALLAKRQAVVRRQIGRLARHAMGHQIRRAGHHHAAHLAEADADQAGIGQFADADGAVDILVEQIDQPVAQIEVDRDLGVGRP